MTDGVVGSVSDLPAVLGGMPVFGEGLRFFEPTLEEPDRVEKEMRDVLDSGRLTDGPNVHRLEERVAEAFRVTHCVAVSSCTVGLMLVAQALEPRGPVLLPSFTFSATAHAMRWNGLEPLFADCHPDTWCLGPDQVYGDPGLIVGVHVSGVPCDAAGLERLAADLEVPLIFDAAHGSGSRAPSAGGWRPLGAFGRAEVFSLTPTKVMSSAEGGLVTTDDADLAARLRVARNYGNPGNYDTLFPGLNARLSELHAVLALHSLDHLEDRVVQRNLLADRYRAVLADLPGIGFQEVPTGGRSCFKDFTILVDREAFGIERDRVRSALAAEGIETRAYYSPPVHHQTAYRKVLMPELPVTERLASRVISLPIWTHMALEIVDRIGEAFHRIHRHADRIAPLSH